MSRVLTIAYCILFSPIAYTQNATPTRVSVKEVVSSPEQYKGRVVQVDGCVIIGFEWQDLFPCEGSERPDRVWLELSQRYHGKRLKDTGTKIQPVVLIGEFHTGARYGHQNGYAFELAVRKVVSVGPKQNIPTAAAK